MSQSGRVRQDEVYRGGITGRRPVVPTAFPELERRARRAMSRKAWAYVAGGAGSEESVRAKLKAFKPKFLKHYASLAEEVEKAAATFASEVREGKYPGAEQSFE